MPQNKEMTVYTILFAVIGLAEQLANGLLKTSFNVIDLLSVFGIIAAYHGVTFGVASRFNSQPGVPPVRYSSGVPQVGGPVNTSIGGINNAR